jgi:ABC-type polysaccharide/polyol phosphate transport system ATPase subunit
VPEQRVNTLKERALHPLQHVRHHTYRALNDVSFVVPRGEFFGIAGRNGSGKSTLLKCMAGIYSFQGQIWRRGRMSTFIELGVGFNPELAARDNVITNGIMMGLTPREARARYDSVIDFAELREFEDLKLKNYSSGMHVRLAFSVAVHVDADILLVDEILAVGDASFQQKCFDVFERIRREGKTLVLVTHTMTQLNRFCDRALLLERGSPVLLAEPHEVADRYLKLNFERPEAAGTVAAESIEAADAHVIRVWLENEAGESRFGIAQGERVTLRALVSFSARLEYPQVSLFVQAEDHRSIVVGTTMGDLHRTGCFDGGQQAVFSFSFNNILAPGRYYPVVDVFRLDEDEKLHRIGRSNEAFSFLVDAPWTLGGAVDMPMEVTIDRVDPVEAVEQVGA